MGTYRGVARLFVAVMPPPGVLDQIERLARPDDRDIRYTTRSQWHVTLSFLGDADPSAAREALPTVAGADLRIGPAVRPLGTRVLVLPVAGLDAAAAEVRRAMEHVVERPPEHEFSGHVTVARFRRSGRAAIQGARLDATFRLDAIHLVESELHPDGARHRIVATAGAAPRG